MLHTSLVGSYRVAVNTTHFPIPATDLQSLFKFSSFVIFTGRSARSAAMPVLFLLIGPKMGFSPRRGDTLPR